MCKFLKLLVNGEAWQILGKMKHIFCPLPVQKMFLHQVLGALPDPIASGS